MAEGGITNTGNSEYLAQGLIDLIQKNKGLQAAAAEFLDQNEDLKNLDLANKVNVIDLLSGNNSAEFLTAISKKLLAEETLKTLAEQIGKDQVMMEKLEALGDKLFINRIIGGAAFTTLTGALAGTFAIGGVAGALVTGGAALVGFFALIAIAAIVHAVYKHRGEIKENVDKSASKVKESTVESGKAIKSLLKDFMDRLPAIQARENNFTKLRKDLLEQHRKSNTEEQTKLNIDSKIEIINMLQNKGKQWAIKELIKDKTIQNFSEKDMGRLIDKATSTHESDMEALKELVDEFLPKIMAIGSDIKEVEQKINEKVQKMESPSSEVVDTTHPTQHSPSTENLGKS